LFVKAILGRVGTVNKIIEVVQEMELFKWLIYGLFVKIMKEFFPKILPYIKQMIREPLFWIILIGLVVLAIIGYISEKVEKENKQKDSNQERLKHTKPEVIRSEHRSEEGYQQVQRHIRCRVQHVAYLDIETTSLNPDSGEITVIGLCLDDGYKFEMIQLCGDEISAPKLTEIIKKAKVLYTYNGTRFDLPYIKSKLGVDLTRYCKHRDLMHECQQRNLYGGFKEIEKKLGIKRKLKGVDGTIAVKLWRNYELYGDRNSLSKLLEYNREDVLNLRTLRGKLGFKRKSKSMQKQIERHQFNKEILEFSQKSKEKVKADFSQRILCSDGNCVGVINNQGVCSICGKPYTGELV
jgi:hypothetical protein